ncbi:MAG: MFS transporter [Spirochaetaceae bacterium]|nr:MFS transporter [Spirochaetaceae bacterium]
MDQTDRPRWRRDAAIFLASQTISLLGSSLVQYALMWHVTLATKSGAMMTLYIVAGFVPTFLLSPFGGVWADRYDRKRLIILADAGIALVTLVLALFFLAGRTEIWLFFVAAAIRAVGQAVQGPAVGAILPQFVPEDKLMRVSGVNGTIQSTIMLVSPILSGALLSLSSIVTIFFIDVGTAAVAIAALSLFLRVPARERAPESAGASHLEDFRLGLRYVRDHRYLLSFFLFLGFLYFLVAPVAFLTPLQATRSYGPEVWRLTAIEIAFSLGMMGGGAFLAAWGGFRNRMRTIVLSTLMMGICTVALGLAPPFWLYLGIMLVFGVGMPFFNTPAAVMLQEHVADDYLGRVFGLLSMLSTSLMPLAMLFFGPLADAVRIEWILLATGAALLLQGFLALGRRRLMEAGLPAARDGAATEPASTSGS